MQRKLTAIVAADVVDYSIHLSRNEVATLRSLNTLRREVFVPLADRYNGKIIRLMGDGSILVFDSALDAVTFAMDVQKAMAGRVWENGGGETPIEFRMGANLCDIILQEDDIHGEGVNVAVRLEELAPPGGLCLSHSIYLQTKNAAGDDLLPIGERHLKNIAEPVFVWRWHPTGDSGPGEVDPFPVRKGNYRGRQILDPQVTALLVDLHMRSARLAISDAFDEMLGEANEGRGMSMEDIYRRLGHRLNAARAMLHPIQIECVGDMRNSTVGLWQNPQSMAEFVSNVFDSASTSYAARLLPIIQKILDADEAPLAKRVRFMTLAQGFMRDDMGPRLKSVIKFGFVETS